MLLVERPLNDWPEMILLFRFHSPFFGSTVRGQKVNMLLLCLRGYVEVWFNNLVADPYNSDRNSSWLEWKKWFLQEFGRHDTEDDLIDALRACEPIDGEHILDFNFRFKVCPSAVPSSVLSDKLKISQYLEAVKLLNEDAVTYCKLQDQGLKTLKNTMDNVVKYFKAFGKLDFASSFTSSVRRNPQARRDRDVTPPPSEKENSQANITRQVQNLALIVERERAGYRRCGRKGHSEDFCRAPECCFCRKIGHIEDRCFSNSSNPQRQSPKESVLR